MTMAPATESVMGSLPRAKAGVGSAVNDTTRQVGGALGVAVVGSLVASIYSSGIEDAGASLGLSQAAVGQASESLGAAFKVASTMGDGGADLVRAASDSFVDGLSIGLRVGAAVVMFAAFVAYRFLPARAHDHVAEPTGDVAPGDLSPVAGS